MRNIKIIDRSKIIDICNFNDNSAIYIPSNREIIRKNTIMINGTAYYIKKDDKYHLINELIGTYLAILLNLESAVYKIGMFNNTLYTLSELFYRKNYEYYYPFEISSNTTYQELRLKRKNYLDLYNDALPILDDKMLTKILKLIAIDLKMGQTDRKGTNIMFECFGDEIDFAPFYDYGSSYNTAEYYTQYKNDFIIVQKDEESLKKFVKKYPLFMEFLNIIRNTGIEDIIENVESINGIKLSDKDIKHYREKDLTYSKMLSKL